MDKIVITGGAKLNGTVTVSGAKNAALPIFFATILAAGQCRLSNIPKLRDIDTTIKIITELGATVVDCGDGVYDVDTSNLNKIEAPYDLVKTMRASVLTLGPLLARHGHAKVSLPGGCAIGERPIDQHLKGFTALGATIDLAHGYVDASRSALLVGSRIVMDLVTVTGVMNIMMAAVTATGTTIIENAPREPEVFALAAFLNKMGATITGAGTAIITITGVDKLHPADFENIPDRIEAGTYLVAAAITGGDVTVHGIDPDFLAALSDKLRATGCVVTEANRSIRVVGPETIIPVDIKTAPHPGFPTDMQAQFMALMTLANGASIITENIFENRFMHVAELRRMGAHIAVNGATATVHGGKKKLSGAEVMATDLRASASLVIAGLAAEGETTIHRVYHLDRGYERLEEKFSHLGANIARVAGDKG
jgi:UDP-N-acetylglucosamine 1-carboxyvinyltransferase